MGYACEDSIPTITTKSEYNNKTSEEESRVNNYVVEVTQDLLKHKNQMAMNFEQKIIRAKMINRLQAQSHQFNLAHRKEVILADEKIIRKRNQIQ